MGRRISTWGGASLHGAGDAQPFFFYKDTATTLLLFEKK